MQWRIRESSGEWRLPRKDQAEAIKNYMETLQKKQSVPYHSGHGDFVVTFGDIITSYTKDNGEKVEVMFGDEAGFVLSNRMMSMFESTKRKSGKKSGKKSSKKSGKKSSKKSSKKLKN